VTTAETRTPFAGDPGEEDAGPAEYMPFLGTWFGLGISPYVPAAWFPVTSTKEGTDPETVCVRAGLPRQGEK